MEMLSKPETLDTGAYSYYTMYYIKEPMTLTVRLKAKQERLLREAVRRLKQTQSQFVREAIMRYAAQCLSPGGATAADRLKNSIGVCDSGGLNLSVDTGARFRAVLKRGHGRRPR